MIQVFKLNEVNSNWIFLLPIITSYLKEDFIYCLLSVSIFIASFYYHFHKEKKTPNTSKTHLSFLRLLDVSIAGLSYFYMFYFVHRYVDGAQNILYGLLLLTVIFYFVGKQEVGKKYNIHTYFHLAIGVVAGLIPLFG